MKFYSSVILLVITLVQNLFGEQNVDEFDMKFAHLASVRRDNYNVHICNGAVLSENWVLTAASCVYFHTAKNLKVRYAEYNLPVSLPTCRISRVIIHEKFNNENFMNNVAMLLTEDDLIFFSTKAVPIPLQIGPIEDGKSVVVTGWKWV